MVSGNYKVLLLEDGETPSLQDIIEWWLAHYEGMEHLTEGGTTSPETWYAVNTILRRCLVKIKEGKR